MKSLGATDLILPCAAGSLQNHVAPGHFVICDQVVDRTRGRKDTFYDGPETTHVSFAEPYDAEMRSVAIDAAHELGHHGARARHAGRDPGSALLDQGRVEVVLRPWAGRSST